MNYPSPLMIARMKKIGMRMPIRTYIAAHETGLPLALACSILMQETGGGLNEFGHDPTIYIGAGAVTRAKYEAYKRERDRPTHGAYCQGVGPVQLTYVGFQDEADRCGGCWKPLVNMRVGFAQLASTIRRDGMWEGVRSYNGSGAAAEKYAEIVLARANGYAERLHVAKP